VSSQYPDSRRPQKAARGPHNTAKPPAHETSGFALSPIRAVFLDSNRWVVELTVKGSNLHLAPSVRFGGSIRQAKVSGRVTAFLRPRLREPRFRCGKKMAPTPLPMRRGQGGALLFSVGASGTGTAKARGLTTPPADAHNVTQSR
jgi:hypothetical protein